MLLNFIVALQIFEAIVWHSAIAAIISIACWAIDELLLREWGQFLVFEIVNTLQNTSWWESPTWSACSLIFYACYSSLLSPVDTWSITRLIKVDIFSMLLVGCKSWISTGIESKKLCFCEIWESIYSHSVGFVWVSIVSDDFSLIRLVDSESVVMFLLIEIEFAVMSDIVMEHCFI